MRGLAVVVVVVGLALAGCGDDDGGNGTADDPSGTSDISPDFKSALDDAASPQKHDFPAPAGRSLKALAGSIQAGGQIGLASSVST